MFLNSSTLASLRFFDAAARLLSFKAAALELHVTQGAVSQHIKQLEEALSCKLFERLPRRIVLTEEGKRFAVVVQSALDEIEQQARAIRAGRATIDIRLRAGPSFALRWLVPRLGEFYARHPGIKLFINAAHGYFDPARREFDLAIELLTPPHPVLHCEVLMDEYLVPVCSPRYLADLALKTPEDLCRCTLLHDAHAWPGGSEDEEWRLWLTAVGAPKLHGAENQFFSLAHMSLEAALANQGVAMGRLSLIKDLIDSGVLITPFDQRVLSPTKYCLLYSEEWSSRPGSTVLIRWLRDQARVSSTQP